MPWSERTRKNKAREILDTHQKELNDLSVRFQKLERAVAKFEQTSPTRYNPSDGTSDTLNDGVSGVSAIVARYLRDSLDRYEKDRGAVRAKVRKEFQEAGVPEETGMAVWNDYWKGGKEAAPESNALTTRLAAKLKELSVTGEQIDRALCFWAFRNWAGGNRLSRNGPYTLASAQRGPVEFASQGITMYPAAATGLFRLLGPTKFHIHYRRSVEARATLVSRSFGVQWTGSGLIFAGKLLPTGTRLYRHENGNWSLTAQSR